MSRAWMPMYWGDYLADTPQFSTAEHGAYLLLIAYYWCNGGLPADENEIRKIAKCTPLAWNKIKRLVMAKFDEQGRHKRIDIELAQTIERSEAARARALLRWQCKSQSQSQSQSQKKEDKKEARSARGARLEKDWWPSIEDCQYAEAHGLVGERLNTEAEKFRNYWTAKAGRDATKLDWHATWQNWVLRAGEKPNGHAPEQKQSLVDRVKGFAERARAYEAAKDAGSADDAF